MNASRLQKLLDKKAQIDAQIKAAAAKQKQQERNDETARKIEAGALALNHMRDNQDSEFYRIMYRLLNQNVPEFRRHLFTEFGIDPAPPKGSNAARKSKTTETAMADGTTKGSSDSGDLKNAFPGSV